MMRRWKRDLRQSLALAFASWAERLSGYPIAIPLVFPAANGRIFLQTHPAASVVLDRYAAQRLHAKLGEVLREKPPQAAVHTAQEKAPCA